MDKSENIRQSEKSQFQKKYTWYDCIYMKFKNTAKLIYGNSGNSYLGAWWHLTASRHGGIFWGGESILYLDWDGC